jgi:hypothetical protein
MIHQCPHLIGKLLIGFFSFALTSAKMKDQAIQNVSYAHLSSWSASLTKDTTTGSIESKQMSFGAKGVGGDNKMSPSLKPRLKPTTMRPLPHSRKQQMHPFMGFPHSIRLTLACQHLL